jgi:hypothetical protein
MSGEPPFRFDIRSKKEGDNPRLIGSIQFQEPVEIVAASRGKYSPNQDIQITRGLVGETTPQPWKRTRCCYTRTIHLAEEIDIGDLIIQEPEAKYKVVDQLVETIKEQGILKEVFEITEEQFGELIYQGPELCYKLMKIHRPINAENYIVVTSFQHTLYRPHPSWKLYQFSRDILKKFIYPSNKHEYGKIQFRISCVEIPSLEAITTFLREAKGETYELKNLRDKIGEIDTEDDQDALDTDQDI